MNTPVYRTSGTDLVPVLELNHVAISVANVERSESFYRDIIGLPVLARPAFPFPGAWFRLGSHQELHLIGGRTAPASGGSMSGHFALRVGDIKAAEKRLRENGVPFRGPGPRPDGALQIFFTDPDGHTIEFCSDLPGRLD